MEKHIKAGNLPTAKEFRISQCVTILQDLSNQDWEELMIEFAKLHVKQALEAAAENVSRSNGGDYFEESILNAYPESNIK